MLHGEGLRKRIKQSTHTRADKKLGRVFVDLSGPKVVESLGRKRYTLIVRADFSRYSWMHCMRHKSDAAELFKQFLANTRTDGVPSKVVIVRSDGGGKFRGGSLETCVDHEVSRRNTRRSTVPNPKG